VRRFVIAIIMGALASACAPQAGDADCFSVEGRDACRLTLTAEQAWPTRGPEPAPLDRQEWARACVISGACAPSAPADGLDLAAARSLGTVACTGQPNASEAAAIPMRPLGSAITWIADERWSFFARAIAPLGSDCAAVESLLTPPVPQVWCREAGCDWYPGGVPPPLVRCDGDIATLLTRDGPFERNCATAFARCDETSSTGCTDRRAIACGRGDFARCDGDIRLGCDGENVTFTDCSRHGGTCVERPRDAECVYPADGACMAADEACNGDMIELCVQGERIAIDCGALGFAACLETPSGPHCSPEG
jgi:hypothetical protein